MSAIPTDRDILNAIYKQYLGTFTAFDKDKPNRSAKIFVPIDVPAIAAKLHVDGDIVFGRLYYHLEKKHGYAQENGTHVPFFALKAGQDVHCVNFPLLASVLADLREQKLQFSIGTWIAVVSLLVAFTSMAIATLK